VTLNTLAFLKAILPEQGIKAARIFPEGSGQGKPSYNQLCDTIEELAQVILKADAAGYTVYHACSSFVSRGKLTKENVLRTRSLWLDVDCGPAKPYLDSSAGARAVILFARQLGLPDPLFVASGLGLHIYWTLDQELERETWEKYARGLKELCRQHQLFTGVERTADIASILRPPGTHHRKGEPLPVECGPLTGPYPLSNFAILLANDPGAHERPQRLRPGSITAAAAHTQVYEPSWATPIAARCLQIRALRDAPGKMNEPTWYAILGVLAYANDGEQFALEHADPEWHDEIKRKLAQWKANTTGAAGCAHLESVNPAGCEGCPFKDKIFSPISLGHRNQPAVMPEVEIKEPATGDVWPVLPEPWAWGNNKQLMMLTDSEISDVLVSEYPIYLDSVQVGEVQGDKVSYLFKQFIPNEGWADIVISAKTMMSSNGVSEMFGRGATIHDAKCFTAYIRYAADYYHAVQRRLMRYDQFGWKEDENAFLFGKTLYTAEGTQEASGSNEIRTRSQWLGPSRGGNLIAWSEAANSLFAKGCEAQSFGLMASLAAPLMRFHSTEEGGAVIALVSPDSGTGKTTALAAAASVWGLNKGIALTNIDTKVSKGLTLGVLGNLPVIYDELHNKDPEVIREFVMMFTNGRDKMRGTSDGEIRHTQSSWQTLLLSGSNISITDLLQAASGVDAPAYRVLEFRATLPKEIAYSQGDRLKKQLEQNCGHAGDAYLRYLIEPKVLEWTKKAVAQYTQDIWAKTKLRSEHRFWVRTIGSVAVAGAIVNKVGILEFKTSRIIDWAMQQIGDANEEPLMAVGSNVAANALAEFLGEHLGDTLVMQAAFRPGVPRTPPVMRPARRLIVRVELDTQRIFISEKEFRSWLLRKELNGRYTIEELKEKGVIMNQKRMMTLGAGTDIQSGQLPCVEINGKHPLVSGVLAPITDFQPVMTSKAPSMTG
jgi:hypothetical protein